MNKNIWDNYLNNIKIKIDNLCKEKKYLSVDLHIHSYCSSDSCLSLKDIILKARKNKFDIISITDHDNIDIYKELYKLIVNGYDDYPIIVPGVEFTINNRDYGSQLHILQYFFNPCDKVINDLVKRNYDASFNRAKIQIDRIHNNKALLYFMNKYNFDYNYDEYIEYIKVNNLIVEYNSMIEYILYKLKIYNISNFDVFDKLEYFNKLDTIDERRKIVELRYDFLRKKYIDKDLHKHNNRMLLSLLSVKNSDDILFDIPSGCLSVNDYGQLTIDELNNDFLTYFAHPEAFLKKDVVYNILNKYKFIKGLELNRRSDNNNYDVINYFVKIFDCGISIGSDVHNKDSILYDDLSFYKIDSKYIKYLNCGGKYGFKKRDC